MGDEKQSEFVARARLAEQAERYEDMVNEMKKIVFLGKGLLSEERNLLSVAYKNVIGARRASWRTINAIEIKIQDSDISQKKQVQAYKTKIENELHESCHDVLKILDDYLIPQVNTAPVGEQVDSKVFYYKMKGDYYRYLAEVSDDEKREEPTKNAQEAYEVARELAKDLAAVHPIKLGLALNFSVFHYEIKNNPTEACNVAKSAFDGALLELDSLADESYKDSTLILQLIRDNLTLWTSESETEERAEDIEDQQNFE